jgi:cell division protein FtsB
MVRPSRFVRAPGIWASRSFNRHCKQLRQIDAEVGSSVLLRFSFACSRCGSEVYWRWGVAVSHSIRIVGTAFYRMRRIVATLCLGLLAAGAGYKVVYGANGTIVYKAKRLEYQQLQQQIVEEQQRHEALQERVRALQSDPKAIEREAREQLGYVKPGETVLVQRQARPEVRAASAIAQNTAAARP